MATPRYPWRRGNNNNNMINASGKVRIDVMMKLCQRVLDGKGIPEDWKTNVMVPIYKEQEDVNNCKAYGMKLL